VLELLGVEAALAGEGLAAERQQEEGAEEECEPVLAEEAHQWCPRPTTAYVTSTVTRTSQYDQNMTRTGS
jgi:hypothetical protein